MLAEVCCVSLVVGLCGFFMSIRILSWNVRGLNNPQKRSD